MSMRKRPSSSTQVIGNCGHGCFPIRDPELSSRIIYGFDGSLPLDWSTPAAYLERIEEAAPAVNVMTLVPNGQLRLATVGLAARPATGEEVMAMIRLVEEGLRDGCLGQRGGAVAEAIRTARNAGVRLQVSHLAPRSGPDHR